MDVDLLSCHQSQLDQKLHPDNLQDAWNKSPIQTAWTRVTFPDDRTCFIFWKQGTNPHIGYRALRDDEIEHAKRLTWRASGGKYNC